MADHASPADSSQVLPTVSLAGGADWAALLAAPQFSPALAKRIAERRWFGAKTRTIRSLDVADTLVVGDAFRLLLVNITFTFGPDEMYQLPLGLALGPAGERVIDEQPTTAWMRVAAAGQSAIVFEPTADPTFCDALLNLVAQASTVEGAAGKLVGRKTAAFDKLCGDASQPLASRLLSSEQSNSSIVFGDRLIAKLFRRIEVGLNPDLEIGDYLTRQGFSHAPPLAGSLEYLQPGCEPWALAIVQAFIASQGNAWDHLLDRLQRSLPALSTPQTPAEGLLEPSARLSAAARQPIPPAVVSVLAPFIASAERLGTRTAELHLALAAGNDAAFAPEPFTAADARVFVDRAVELVRDSFQLLRNQLPRLAGEIKQLAERTLAHEAVAAARFNSLVEQPARVSKIRVHGDYHLGQVLVVGDDFLIIDFEGEPARSLAERREKQLALRDVAGMIRSFHYASCAAAVAIVGAHERLKAVNRAARAWYFWISTAFLGAYLRTAAGASFVPASTDAFARVLDACLLQKAIYELRYELNNRPDWIHLPLRALDDLLGEQSGSQPAGRTA